MSTEHDINSIKNGLTDLVSMIDDLSNKKPEPVNIVDRSISGNAITGGTITKFSSVGIRDDSTRLVVLVNNDGLLTDFIDVETLVGTVNVEDNLNVGGTITADVVKARMVVSENTEERTSSVEFLPTDNGVYGQGLVWKKDGQQGKLVFLPNPDRIFSSNSIDIQEDASYQIGKLPVLSASALGTSITKSNLMHVGTLQGLSVDGNITIDDFVFWNSESMRWGIGNEAPNGMFSVTSLDAEFVIDPEGDNVKLGTYTTDGINIVTDDVTRINVSASGKINIGAKGATDARVSINGRLGIGVNNLDNNLSITTSEAVKFQGKLQEVGSGIPTSGIYNKGDIVWNDNPKPTGYVGWICTREGTPGVWKPFGQIAS